MYEVLDTGEGDFVHSDVQAADRGRGGQRGVQAAAPVIAGTITER